MCEQLSAGGTSTLTQMDWEIVNRTKSRLIEYFTVFLRLCSEFIRMMPLSYDIIGVNGILTGLFQICYNIFFYISYFVIPRVLILSNYNSSRQDKTD